MDVAVSSWDTVHPEPQLTPVFTRKLLLPSGGRVLMNLDNIFA